MRLQPAIDLEDFEDTMDEFGDSERREARRGRRRRRKAERRERRADRRGDRRERRQERRLDKVQRKKAKVRDKLARVPAEARPLAPRRARRPAEPTLEPAPTSWPPDDQQDDDGGWVEDALDSAEDFVDELDPEEGEDDATEGMGAWQPFRRRAATARPPAGEGAWGPSVRLGRKLRIQAAVGHRAAVIDLKPGLYLVAELPDAVTRTEFGVVPLLAPLMITAARRAMDESPRERRGPLGALFRRREPIRYVQVRPAPQAPAATPLALPGPVADEPAVVAAPNVGWADDATVAAAYGCDRCERERR